MDRRYPRDISVFGIGFNAVPYRKAVEMLAAMPVDDESAYASFSNVNVLMACRKDPAAVDAINSATINCIDGMPIRWIAQKKGFSDCERCSGPDLMAEIFTIGVAKGWRHYFYGTTDQTLRKLCEQLKARYPGIVICGMEAPPFRPLTAEEDAATVARINAAKPDWVWVGLGAPKQDKWMYGHKHSIWNTRMMGVGAAFNFFSGTVRRAPNWMQKSGLEWLYRLLQEPGRLWKRYLVGNVQFLFHIVLDRDAVQVFNEHMRSVDT